MTTAIATVSTMANLATTAGTVARRVPSSRETIVKTTAILRHLTGANPATTTPTLAPLTTPTHLARKLLPLSALKIVLITTGNPLRLPTLTLAPGTSSQYPNLSP